MTLSVSTASFLKKLAIYGAIAAVTISCILLFPQPFKLPFQFVLGVMFAHGVELSHEMIHQKHFGRRWGGAIGFLLGLPLGVEFTRYSITHSYHHRAVGTPDDEESFSYDFGRLGAPLSFLLHLSMLSHYCTVAHGLLNSLLGNEAAIRDRMGPAGKTAPHRAIARVMRGYRIMALLLFAVVLLSLALRTTAFIHLWLIPLLFAGPVHALIELPEHWGCQRDTTDMMVNTRTILPSRFADWLTNGNCWHVEHHYKPSLPMADLPKLHEAIAPQIKYLNLGYGEFYREFFIALLGQGRSLSASQD
ncbi:fatty acid desaturase [Thermoleptolyngbya sp.]